MSTAPLLVEVIGGPKVVIDLDPKQTIEEIATAAAAAVDKTLVDDDGEAKAWRLFAPKLRGGFAPAKADARLGKVAEAMRKLKDSGEPGGFAGPGTHEGKDYLFRIRLFVPSPPPPKPVEEAPPPIDDEEAIDLTNLDVDADELETVRHVELKAPRKKKRRRSEGTRSPTTGERIRKKKRRTTGELPSQASRSGRIGARKRETGDLPAGAGKSGRIRKRSTGEIPERASRTGRIRKKKRRSGTRPPGGEAPPAETTTPEVDPPEKDEAATPEVVEPKPEPAAAPPPKKEPAPKATVSRPKSTGAAPPSSGPGTLTPEQQGAPTAVMGQDAVAALLADGPAAPGAGPTAPPKTPDAPTALRPEPKPEPEPAKLEMPKRVPRKTESEPERDPEATRPYRRPPSVRAATLGPGTSTGPEAGKPEARKSEPGKPGPTKSEPREPEPGKPEATKPEPGKPEASKPEPTKPEPTKPEPTKPEPTKPEPTKGDPAEDPAAETAEGKVAATRVVARALDVPAPEPGSTAMTGSVRRSDATRGSGTMRRTGSSTGTRSGTRLGKGSTAGRSTGAGRSRSTRKKSSSGMLGLLAALLLFAAVTVAFVVVLLKTEPEPAPEGDPVTDAPAEMARLSDALQIEAWSFAQEGDPVSVAVGRFNELGADSPERAAEPTRLAGVQDLARELTGLCDSGASFHACEAWSRVAFAAYQGCRSGACEDEMARAWFLQSIQAADLALPPLKQLEGEARSEGSKRLTVQSVRLAGQSMPGLRQVSPQLATLAQQACEGALAPTPDCNDALAAPE